MLGLYLYIYRRSIVYSHCYSHACCYRRGLIRIEYVLSSSILTSQYDADMFCKFKRNTRSLKVQKKSKKDISIDINALVIELLTWHPHRASRAPHSNGTCDSTACRMWIRAHDLQERKRERGKLGKWVSDTAQIVSIVFLFFSFFCSFNI